jgi:hypothetical protein
MLINSKPSVYCFKRTCSAYLKVRLVDNIYRLCSRKSLFLHLLYYDECKRFHTVFSSMRSFLLLRTTWALNSQANKRANRV